MLSVQIATKFVGQTRAAAAAAAAATTKATPTVTAADTTTTTTTAGSNNKGNSKNIAGLPQFLPHLSGSFWAKVKKKKRWAS